MSGKKALRLEPMADSYESPVYRDALLSGEVVCFPMHDAIRVLFNAGLDYADAEFEGQDTTEHRQTFVKAMMAARAVADELEGVDPRTTK